MYFVNRKYKNAVVWGKKKTFLSSATQSELQDLFKKKHPAIEFKETPKAIANEKPQVTKRKRNS